MPNNFFPVQTYNPLGFNPQMPYSPVNTPLQQTAQGPQNFAPNYIDPNQQQSKSQYQMHPSWQFGLNYNQIAFSSAVQGVGAFLRGNNQRKDFNAYNKVQNNPLSQLPQNGNTSEQALYGDRIYKRGGMKRYDVGGPGPGERPTTADSLALYNNALQVQQYYANNKSYQNTGKYSGIQYDANYINNAAFNSFKQNNNSGKGIDIGTSNGWPQYKKLQDTDYRRDLNQNQYYQREQSSSILDLNAPMPLYDKRISPTNKTFYKNNDSTDRMYGDAVELYGYDPIAVKPTSMLTPQERQERAQKYGDPQYNQNPNSDFSQTGPHTLTLKQKPQYQAPRANVNSQVQSQGSSNPIGGNLNQPNVAAGQSGPYSFTGRIGDGTQATQFFNDPDVWKQATEQYGYSHRDQTGNTGTATGYMGTGAHLKKGGNVKFAEGGKFDDFDNFDEDDFQDLKDELDKYFNDKGEPQETKSADLQEDEPKTEVKTEDKEDDDKGPRGQALSFLDSDSGENGNDDKPIEQSDKDIADQLAGIAPIPQPSAPPIPAANQTAYSTKPTDELTAFKRGIAQVENAGYGEANKNSSAFGKYQFTAPTREAVREQYFPDIKKDDFETSYKADPQFQERVMDVYGNHLLQQYPGSPHSAALAFFMGPGKANYENKPDYRPTPNNVTVGQYLKSFDAGYNKKKSGGHISIQPQSIPINFGIPTYKQEYKEGGTYEMSKAQIDQLRREGYEIEEI